jgi:hypothetical protein
VSGREALNLCLLKRMGDGNSVSIWTDKWILGIRTMTPSAQISRDDPNRVSNLIDTEPDGILNIP